MLQDQGKEEEKEEEKSPRKQNKNIENRRKLEDQYRNYNSQLIGVPERKNRENGVKTIMKEYKKVSQSQGN